MKKTIYLTAFLSILIFGSTYAQVLKPGFNKAECIEMLRISSRFGQGNYVKNFPEPVHYKMDYRSPITGLDNCWDLWVGKPNDAWSSTAVISLRGTTQNTVSWLANFYAAMIPATGELQISKTDTFKYQLSSNPKAAVHTGWMISLAFMSKGILHKIDSCYKQGIKEIIITGHSQGGAIAYLLTAYLYNLQKQNQLPADIRLKTYCTAAPKPGNLFFAYEYEATTRNWAYNMVNSADWVPETPMSVQILNDFNATNPFTNVKATISKMPFPKNLAMRYAFNRLDKPTRRAQRNYQKYLGTFTSKMVKEQIPGYMPPKYFESSNYVRTGNMVVLLVDEDYYKLYPDNPNTAFVHHMHPPYLHLAEKLPDNL